MQEQILYTKNIDAIVKSSTPEGKIYGIASTPNIDLDNEIIAFGAFQKSIDEFNARQKSIPILFEHEYKKTIGNTIELKYESENLMVGAQLYIHEETMGYNPLAQKTFNEATKYSFSVGFYGVKSHYENINGKNVKVFDEVNLQEISVTANPANIQSRVERKKSYNPEILQIEDNKINQERIRNIKSMDDLDGFLETFCDMKRPIRKVFIKTIENLSAKEEKTEFQVDNIKHDSSVNGSDSSDQNESQFDIKGFKELLNNKLNK